MEPILNPEFKRYTAFPIRYPTIHALLEKSRRLYWPPHEIELSKDKADFDKLSDEEKHFLKMVIGFFAASDGIVNANLDENFLSEITDYDIQALYRFQAMMEDIHSQVYGSLIDVYIEDPDERLKLLNSISTIETIKKKAQWAFKWFNKDIPFSHRLIAFACVEGIFFAGSFCAIFWFREKGVLPGLTQSNELISRDESIHVETAVEIYKLLVNKPDKEIVYQIIRDIVECEKEFIKESLPWNMVNMNARLMTQYIEYTADYLIKMLGIEPLYNVSCPFHFMERISMVSKSNFFERHSTNYSIATRSEKFSLDSEF